MEHWYSWTLVVRPLAESPRDRVDERLIVYGLVKYAARGAMSSVSGADRRFVSHDIDLDRKIRHRLVSSMLQTWCIAAIGPKSYAPRLQ
jgi:hypothetical protein